MMLEFPESLVRDLLAVGTNIGFVDILCRQAAATICAQHTRLVEMPELAQEPEPSMSDAAVSARLGPRGTAQFRLLEAIDAAGLSATGNGTDLARAIADYVEARIDELRDDIQDGLGIRP